MTRIPRYLGGNHPVNIGMKALANITYMNNLMRVLYQRFTKQEVKSPFDRLSTFMQRREIVSGLMP